MRIGLAIVALSALAVTLPLAAQAVKPASPQSTRARAGNECGSGYFRVLIPDAVRGLYDFSAACRRHDRCYDTLGRSKGSCDREFFQNMRRTCLATHRSGGKKLERCLKVARIYWLAVVTGGRKYYERAQREARRRARPPGPPPMTFTVPAQLPDAVLGTEYRYSFCEPAPAETFGSCGQGYTTTNPSGGNPPYAFDVPGAPSRHSLGPFPLPDFALISSSGVMFAGRVQTPAPGTYRFTVCARDDAGRGRNQICRETSIVVRTAGAPPPPPPPPTATLTFSVPERLPDAVVNEMYSYTFDRPRGGVPPYTFSLLGAPAGIRVNRSTGVLSGTPYVIGDWRFSVCVADSSPRPRSVCASTSLRVKAKASLYDGIYRGRITWSWGPPIVYIESPEAISFTVRDSTISGDLVGTIDATGNARVRVTTFGSRGNISGTVRFAQSGSTVSVTGTVSGTLTTLGGTGRVEGRVRAERASP